MPAEACLECSYSNIHTHQVELSPLLLKQGKVDDCYLPSTSPRLLSPLPRLPVDYERPSQHFRVPWASSSALSTATDTRGQRARTALPRALPLTDPAQPTSRWILWVCITKTQREAFLDNPITSLARVLLLSQAAASPSRHAERVLRVRESPAAPARPAAPPGHPPASPPSPVLNARQPSAACGHPTATEREEPEGNAGAAGHGFAPAPLAPPEERPPKWRGAGGRPPPGRGSRRREGKTPQIPPGEGGFSAAGKLSFPSGHQPPAGRGPARRLT